MKKDYIKPQALALRIMQSHILAGSDNVTIQFGGINNNPSAKATTLDFEDEE